MIGGAHLRIWEGEDVRGEEGVGVGEMRGEEGVGVGEMRGEEGGI